MIDPLDDGDLAQARRRVQVLEAEVRKLHEMGMRAGERAHAALSVAAEARADRSAALRLRDASALEHERERTRRQEAEVLLADVADLLFRLGGYDERVAEIRAHLTRQGETT